MQDILGSLELLHVLLEVGEGDPGSRGLWELLKVFLVDRTHPVKLAELFLHLDIGSEHLFSGAAADSSSEDLSSFVEINTSQVEVSIADPEPRESKDLMGDEFKGFLVNLVRFEEVFGDLFLEYCVVIPQIDIPSPEPLFFCWRDLLNCSLIHFSRLLDIPSSLLQLCQIDPRIIIE